MRFKDGYSKTYSEKELDQILVLVKRKTEGRQLDYIFVSDRWQTSVQDASVKWGPSEHRNIQGKADHALVCCKWVWRLQANKSKKVKDFGALDEKTREGRQVIAKFNEAVTAKTEELRAEQSKITIERQYEHLCEAINHAIRTTLPDRQNGKRIHRSVSERTRDMFKKRTKMGKSKTKYTKDDFDKIQKKIKESSMRDHAEWVHACAEEMASANDVGDTRKLYQLVKQLSGKEDKQPAVDLSVDKQGAVITNAVERAEVWYEFLKSKFAATAAEQGRPEMPTLPARDADNKLKVEEVWEAVSGLKNHKAVGADGIPIEVYKLSSPAFELLYNLLERVWREEDMPEDLGVAIFKMLYKRKGSPNDPSKYRCIGLLNSGYKVLSAVMLKRLQTETKGYLKDWQAGFRQGRGCRDNVLILRTLIEKMLREDKSLILTFIDYSAAFDSVGHKFLDHALGQATAKPKTRAIFRKIYSKATAKTRVKSIDGQHVYSKSFPVRRGVIQGDITSPLYFIIALEAILRKYDNITGKGVPFGGRMLHTLGYADDAALIDSDTAMASRRVSSIARGSKEAADMQINIAKTECMHVKRQFRVAAPNKRAARKVCQYKCNNPGCGWIFGNKLGLRIHQGKWCEWNNYYQVERILDHKCSELPVGIGKTRFLVKWKGYSHDYNEWVDYENVTKAAITEYLRANGKYEFSWRYRCTHCDKPCRSQQGVKVHYAAKCKRKCQRQAFKGTVAQRLHTEEVLADRQALEEKVLCEGKALKNSYKFKYLGSMFTADGNDEVDIRRRIAMAVPRCGQLRFILGAENIPLQTKVMIYKSAVGSLFTYGSEAWNLSEKNMRKLNGANAGCLQRFTGKSRVEESREASCTYSLCKDIRKRRKSWLGHILRMKKYKDEGGTEVERLVKTAVRVQHEMGGGGSLLKDAPTHLDFAGLEALAGDRTAWKKRIDSIFGRKSVKGKKKKRRRKDRCKGLSSTGGKILGRRAGKGADSVWIGPPLQPQHHKSPLTRAKASTDAKFPILSSLGTEPAKTVQARLSHYWVQSQVGKKGDNTNSKSTKPGDDKKSSGKPKCSKSAGKTKTVTRTDAQRAAWAHAHFIIHHGTGDDAKRFMSHPKNIANTPEDALHEVQKMAAMRIPTWAEAAAAVFSSSSSEDSLDVANETGLQPAGPTEWDTKAKDIDISGAKILKNLSMEATDNKTTADNDNLTAPTTPNDAANSDNAVAGRCYRTRSRTARARAQAAADSAKKEIKHQPNLKPQNKPKKRCALPKPSIRPKRVRIAPSQISGAGMGLYMDEDVKAGEWIARYSGEPLSQAECERRQQSHYRLQVHRNLFLDAADKRHFEGRYINDARKTKFKVNARFASSYKTNTCSATGYVWVRIYATRPIKAGEEIFLNYGAAFWRDMQLGAVQTPNPSLANNIPSTTNSATSQASSIWAASAYIPGDTPEHDDDQCNMAMTTQQHNSETSPITIIWPDQTPAPSSPALLGHFTHTNQQYIQDTAHPPHHQLIQFPTPLSPITHGPSSNPHIHMNEIYSFHQMYNIDDTILLPVSVDNQ